MLTLRTEPLLASLPSRARALAEALLVLALVLGPHYTPPGAATWMYGFTLFLCAVSLVQPWSPERGTPAQRALSFFATAVAIAVPIGATHHTRYLFAALAVRGVCVVMLIFVLARSDGQRVSALGISREGLLRDVLYAVPTMVGAFVADILAALPIAALKLAGGGSLLDKETATRQQVLHALSSQVSLAGFAVAMLFTATFEEVVFRAFLLPRTQKLVGSWVASIAVVNVLFGLGHLYEGTLASFQVAVLGVYFSVVFLWTGRLFTVALAHALFNIIVFAAASSLL